MRRDDPRTLAFLVVEKPPVRQRLPRRRRRKNPRAARRAYTRSESPQDGPACPLHPDSRRINALQRTSAMRHFRTFSLQHCTVRLRHLLATVNAAVQTYTQRSRGRDNLTTARRSQNSSASKIRTRCACRLIAHEKTSAASCLTRKERQWMAMRLMRSAHY